MDAHALMVKTVRDGPACTLILRGDLDLAGVPFLPVERSAPFLAGTEGCP